MTVPHIEDYLKILAHPLRQAGGSRFARRKVNPDLPLVSILTVVRDRKETLQRTIRSVLSQTYPNIEYIIVDGASTDGTLEVIRQFDDKIDRWISEPDRGASDAMNKAISLARGEYVSWLSSDDWFDPDFIEIAVRALSSSGADFVFGDLRTYRADALVQHFKGDQDESTSIRSEVQSLVRAVSVTRTDPTMVTRRECFQEVGLFDLNYEIRNDFEWILRLHLHGRRGRYESKLIGHFGLGGNSDSGSDFKHIFEDLRILRQHRLLTARIAAPYLYRLARYSIGHLAKFVLPATIHRELKRAMRRGHSARIV